MPTNRPARGQSSYRVDRELLLSYVDDLGMVYTKTITVGEHLWHTRLAGDHTYFLDMDGAEGSVIAYSPSVLYDNGSLHLTGPWVSWDEAHTAHDLSRISRPSDSIGDALERIRTT